ncbi:MAG: hypothetical protein RLZ55_808 [Actinomycetota bacterium]
MVEDAITDADRRRALRRMKAIPLGLLLLAAIVFIVSWYFEKQPGASAVWGYVRAMAEAGMVGGLADWFAVTALFRHPLGLPIPHTALIPAKKDQLGSSLADFVRRNFLNPDVVRARVAAADPAQRLGSYLQVPEHRATLLAEGAGLAAKAIESIDDDEAQLLVRNVLFTQAAAYAWAPPAGRLLDAAVTDQTHQPAVEAAFRAARDWVAANRETIVTIVADRGPAQGFFLARATHEAIGIKAHKELLKWLTEAVDDPSCATRRAVDRWLLDSARRLREDPVLIEKVETFKQQVLTSAETQEAVAALWPTVRQIALNSLADPDGDLRRRAESWVSATADRLVVDQPFRAAVNGRIESAAAYVSERYGAEAVVLISETVARWDATEASDRIELQVGRDLQWIRVNGTVVGALAGLVIHAVGSLLMG